MRSFILTILFAGIACAPVEEFESNPMLGKYFGGDMLGVFVNTKGVAQLENYQYKRWPKGKIPYVIDTDYSRSQIDIILGGMRKIEAQVGVNCIQFVPRANNHSTYLKIEGKNTGCYSWVGMQTRVGPQVLSLSRNGCLYAGIVIHELLHAIGFHHEQNRPDRDNFIKVNYENISPDMAYNFDKMISGVTTQGFPYDYNSIMHYEDTAFSKNGQKTMVPLQSGVTLLPAYKKYAMTATDINEVKKWYGCLAV